MISNRRNRMHLLTLVSPGGGGGSKTQLCVLGFEIWYFFGFTLSLKSKGTVGLI